MSSPVTNWGNYATTYNCQSATIQSRLDGQRCASRKTNKVQHTHMSAMEFAGKELSQSELFELFLKVQGDLAVFRNRAETNHTLIYHKGVAIAEDEYLLELIKKRLSLT